MANSARFWFLPVAIFWLVWAITFFSLGMLYADSQWTAFLRGH